MVHSLWHTSNRPLVIPFMAAVLGPLEHTAQDPVEPLLLLSPFYVRWAGVLEPSYSLGPRTFLLLPPLTQPSARFPSPDPVRRRCRSASASVNDDGSRVGDEWHRSPSHPRATKITIITWTVCQVTSLPPLPSSLQRESARVSWPPSLSNCFKISRETLKKK